MLSLKSQEGRKGKRLANPSWKKNGGRDGQKNEQQSDFLIRRRVLAWFDGRKTLYTATTLGHGTCPQPAYPPPTILRPK